MVRALGAFIALGVVLSPTERFPEPTQQLTTIQGIQPPLISENRHTSVILNGITYIDTAKILTYIK